MSYNFFSFDFSLFSPNRRSVPTHVASVFCDTAKFFVLLQTNINQQNTSFLRQNSKKVKL